MPPWAAFVAVPVWRKVLKTFLQIWSSLFILPCPESHSSLAWLFKCWRRVQLSPSATGTAEFKFKCPPRLSSKQSEFINFLLTGILIRNQCFLKDIQYQDPENYTFCLAVIKKELKSLASTNLGIQTAESCILYITYVHFSWYFSQRDLLLWKPVIRSVY